jgi:tRNA/tmRNA/rRNA uracil-C5-methylase (TrmA/RlmC/RlmD family)
MRELVQLAPARVAYVSCDPPTLGRDAATLAQHGWRLARLAAFDMFPRTYHVEMAALFVR